MGKRERERSYLNFDSLAYTDHAKSMPKRKYLPIAAPLSKLNPSNGGNREKQGGPFLARRFKLRLLTVVEEIDPHWPPAIQ